MTKQKRLSAMLLALILMLVFALPLSAGAETAASPAPAGAEESQAGAEPDGTAPMETNALPETSGGPEPAELPVESTPAPSASPAPYATMAITAADAMPTPGAEAKAEAIVTSQSGTGMFELPSHESSVLSQLEAGSVLTLVLLGQSWCKVSNGSQEGYAPTSALSFAFGAAQPALAIVVAPNGKLTLRAEMTTKSKALATIRSGRAVLLLARGEKFSLVRHEGEEGYVLSEFLKEVPVNEQLGTYTGVVSLVSTREANVRLRGEPGKNAPVYTSVRSGNGLVVLDIQDGWAQVEYEGYHGYMMAEYLKRFD